LACVWVIDTEVPDAISGDNLELPSILERIRLDCATLPFWRDASELFQMTWLRSLLVIFLGSLLLFLVQPIAGQRLLPALGGSPAVWLTCIMFFQACLLLGYSWVWLIGTWLGLRGQVLAQTILLLLVYVICVPLDLDTTWLNSTEAESAAAPVWTVVRYLAAHLGLPAIALSTTSPLIQSWLAKLPDQPSPYRWFAISSLVNLLALVLYPIYIQPNVSLDNQIRIWSGGLVGFLVCFVWNGVATILMLKKAKLRLGRDRSWEISEAASSSTRVEEWQNLRLRRSAIWAVMCLSFFPSVLLSAVSNQITADVGAVPLLWVIPLALYLFTFSMAFGMPKIGLSYWLDFGAFVGAIILFVCVWLSRVTPAGWQVIGVCGGMFWLCLLCHARMVRLQPGSVDLPLYYWLISLSGFAGGAFVGGVAPVCFSNFYELELAVLGCWASGRLLGQGVALVPKRSGQSLLQQAGSGQGGEFSNAFEIVSGGKGALIALKNFDAGSLTGTGRWDRFCRRVTWGATAVICLLALVGVFAKYPSLNRSVNGSILLNQSRTFFGVLKVKQLETDLGTMRVLGHGTTDHGRQLMAGPYADMPSGYYAPGSGLGLAFDELRRASSRPGIRVAVLGLGAGNILHWGQPEDHFTFYEIDQAVVALAREYFPNLRMAKATVEVKVGDGRNLLRLERQANGPPHDLIIMDAFSGDSVPTHLLTKEAFDVYLQRLKLDGVIAVHISNRYVDLGPVLRAVARANRLEIQEVDFRPASEWVGGVGNQILLEQLAGMIPETACLSPCGFVHALARFEVDPRRSRWILLSRVPFQKRVAIATNRSESRIEPNPKPAIIPPNATNTEVLWTDDYSPIWRLLK